MVAGNDLVLAHPHDAVQTARALLLSAGPTIYQLRSG